MDGEFFYNVWNLSNHEREIARNPQGACAWFALDGKWKVRVWHGDTPENVTTMEIDAAVDLAAWLNKYEYKPTWEKVEE